MSCTPDAMLLAFVFCCFRWRNEGPPLCCELAPVPGHPWTRYKVERDPEGGTRIICHCTYCGHRWQRGCSQQRRVGTWVFRFSVLHGHGYHPVLKP